MFRNAEKSLQGAETRPDRTTTRMLSGSVAVIVVQHAAQSLAPIHRAATFEVPRFRVDQSVSRPG